MVTLKPQAGPTVIINRHDVFTKSKRGVAVANTHIARLLASDRKGYGSWYYYHGLAMDHWNLLTTENHNPVLFVHDS